MPFYATAEEPRPAQKKTVRALREQYGWRQWQLALKADVSQRTISDIETRDKPVSSIIANKIANAFGVPLDCLLIAIIRQ